MRRTGAASLLNGFLIAGVAGYAVILAFLYFNQRRLLYFPDTQSIAPAVAGFSRAQAHELKTPDGVSLVAWYAPPESGKPLIIYFHGNAGQIAGRSQRFAALTRDGTGLLAVSYRGYSGSSGAPDEAGLITDAHAAYDFALSSGGRAETVVLLGESLGSGVAIALAEKVKVAGVLLEAPYSSIVDVAAARYWMFPVRLLMHDQFRSDLRIAQVKAPVMIVHGTADRVVPVHFGEKLFTLAKEPKTMVRAQGEGHQPLDNAEILVQARNWIFTTVNGAR